MPYGNTLIITANGAGVMDGSDPEGQSGGYLPARDDVNDHTMGHSLWAYTGGDLAQETPLTLGGEWVGRLAANSGRNYGGTFTFGQYSNHLAQSWPNINISGEYTNNTQDPNPNADGFPGENYNQFMTMPSNFLESDMGGPPYSQPVAGSAADCDTLFGNARTSYPSCELFLYVHEPDAGQWAGGLNKSDAERSAYNQAVYGDYWTWHKNKSAAITRQHYLVPVGPSIARIWENEAYLQNNVAFNEMYGDDAPHGSENIYLLKAIVFYRVCFRQRPNVVGLDLSGATQLIPEITNNLTAIESAINDAVIYFDTDSGGRVLGTT